MSWCGSLENPPDEDRSPDSEGEQTKMSDVVPFFLYPFVRVLIPLFL